MCYFWWNRNQNPEDIGTYYFSNTLQKICINVSMLQLCDILEMTAALLYVCVLNMKFWKKGKIKTKRPQNYVPNALNQKLCQYRDKTRSGNRLSQNILRCKTNIYIITVQISNRERFSELILMMVWYLFDLFDG